MVARPSTSCHVYTAVQMVLAKVFASTQRQETVEPCPPLRTVVGILVGSSVLLLLPPPYNLLIIIKHNNNNNNKLYISIIIIIINNIIKMKKKW